MSRDRERDPLVVSRVIGDVLDPFTRSVALSISYNSREVANGRAFKPSTVANQPRVVVGGNDLRIFYTLAMVDPDAPSPSDPNLREYLHWFVFVLFQQMGRQTVYEPGWRQNFVTRDFAELYNLGSPVAAVFFNCQRESGCGGRRSS